MLGREHDFRVGGKRVSAVAIIAVLALGMVPFAAHSAWGQNTLTAPTSDAFVNISDIPSTATSDSADIEYHLYGNPAAPTRPSRLVTESWWWYRFGGENDETIFHDPSAEFYTADTATFEFDENLFDAKIGMQLFDDRLVENLSFMLRERDHAGVPIEGEHQINLFHNSDIDLGHNVPDNDAADAFVNHRILVAGTDGPAYLYYEDTTADSLAYIVVDNDSVPDLEDLMVDLLPTAYANTGLPFGASDGDISLGYQWKFLLSPGEMVNVAISYEWAVPEPAAILLALLGLALLPRHRRRPRACGHRG